MKTAHISVVFYALTWSPGQRPWPCPAHCSGCVLPVSPLAPPPAPPPSAGTDGSSPTRCALEFPADVSPGWAPADRWPPALRSKIERKVEIAGEMETSGWPAGWRREGRGESTKKCNWESVRRRGEHKRLKYRSHAGVIESLSCFCVQVSSGPRRSDPLCHYWWKLLWLRLYSWSMIACSINSSSHPAAEANPFPYTFVITWLIRIYSHYTKGTVYF